MTIDDIIDAVEHFKRIAASEESAFEELRQTMPEREARLLAQAIHSPLPDVRVVSEKHAAKIRRVKIDGPRARRATLRLVQGC